MGAVVEAGRARDPRVPWYAKAVAIAVAAYALSPIPDFIPVLGQLDELVVLPLGIMLALKLIPPELMKEHRVTAARVSEEPTSRTAAAVIVLIWVACISGLVAWCVYRRAGV
jgi:uncharacterized membrane protein YkvA (DUF1232 family)